MDPSSRSRPRMVRCPPAKLSRVSVDLLPIHHQDAKSPSYPREYSKPVFKLPRRRGTSSTMEHLKAWTLIILWSGHTSDCPGTPATSSCSTSPPGQPRGSMWITVWICPGRRCSSPITKHARRGRRRILSFCGRLRADCTSWLRRSSAKRGSKICAISARIAQFYRVGNVGQLQAPLVACRSTLGA